ncbi:alpha/beta hydrolase [Kiloniella majae]|uniref:alpha/beta hydrolase n=1 Tax=Kiloniella majae TaxID=1938558 RepID=UPI000A278DF3|nr:alpha/beta hydrolase [Kiloniella majae]
MKYKIPLFILVSLIMTACVAGGSQKFEQSNDTSANIILSNDNVENTNTNQGYALIKTFFATDRVLTNTNLVRDKFGFLPSDDLSLGYAYVTIPTTSRSPGELNTPFEFWGYRPFESITGHIILQKAPIVPEEEYWESLQQRIKKSDKKSAFIFIHGFNVSFEDAARRTAQISYDLKFQGAPIFYSWPSKGKVLTYSHDATTIERTREHLKPFLKKILAQTEVENFYIIAHSMGTRAVTKTLGELMRERPSLSSKITEVILAAPDIDAVIFRNQIAPKLTMGNRPVTLYRSADDKAMTLSKIANGFARIGDGNEEFIFIPGIEVIDATGKTTDFLNHSYFIESYSVITDIENLIKTGQRANDRKNLKRVGTLDSHFWKFK